MQRVDGLVDLDALDDAALFPSTQAADLAAGHGRALGALNMLDSEAHVRSPVCVPLSSVCADLVDSPPVRRAADFTAGAKASVPKTPVRAAAESARPRACPVAEASDIAPESPQTASPATTLPLRMVPGVSRLPLPSRRAHNP